VEQQTGFHLIHLELAVQLLHGQTLGVDVRLLLGRLQLIHHEDYFQLFAVERLNPKHVSRTALPEVMSLEIPCSIE